MKVELIVAVAIRLFAVVLGLYALRNGISFSAYLFEEGQAGSAYMYGALMAAVFIACIGLWRFPLTLARGLVPISEKHGEEAQQISSDQLLEVGLVLLGIYFLFGVISDIGYWISMLVMSSRDIDAPLTITLKQKALVLSTVVEAVLVMFLLLGKNRVLELFRKARYG